MKLLLKQYLASLKERDELDIVLPDILSEVGFTVISRPMRGTTQYGVDVVAVGRNTASGAKTLYLLSIKSGDLTRSEWASGEQALRPSLEEILDVYIPKHLPVRYKDLPIIIALCFGGDVQENVRTRVDGFIDRNTVPSKIAFEEWNGDHIASLIATGLLRENIFPREMQTSFRKAVALVDEPAVCVAHFTNLINQLTDAAPKNNAERLRIARQIYLASWTVFIWCRDAENLEAAFQSSAVATLHLWNWCHTSFGSSVSAKALGEVMKKMVGLNHLIADTFIEQHVAPYCDVQDGLGASVPSASSTDINLQLFEVLGRVALNGIWLIHKRSLLPDTASPEIVASLDDEISKASILTHKLIQTNPVLFTPLRDDHAIEITLTGLFLKETGAGGFFRDWIEQITLSSIFSHRTNSAYPCVLRDYARLAAHPKSTEGYQEEATAGSILYPTLGVWLSIYSSQQTFSYLAEFHASDMKHSNWQLWVPDDVTDEHLYTNSAVHGACVSDLRTADGTEALLNQINKEIEASSEFADLSAIRLGCWPIVLMACHFHRLPIPPHFWAMDFSPHGSVTESAN